MTLQSVSRFCEQVGAEWVVWVLAGLFFIVIGVAVQRIWALRTLAGDPSQLVSLLSPIFTNKPITAPTQAKLISGLRVMPSVAAALAEAAVGQAHRGADAAEKSVEAHILIERLRLDRGLALLSTVATNAPFVGLLGTVIGVMHAFAALGVEQAQADVTTQLMAGVAEALVTTGVGLAVALPAVIAHNYLQQRSEAILSGARALAGQLVAALPEASVLHRLRSPEEREQTWA